HEPPAARLEAAFNDESRFELSAADVPTQTESAGVVGEVTTHTLADLMACRIQQVEFAVARRVLDRFNTGGPDEGSQVWLFPQLLEIARQWMRDWVRLKDSAFPQLLLLAENTHRAAEKIHLAIRAAVGQQNIRALTQGYDEIGSTAGMMPFDTVKPRWTTAEDRCHINFVPCDSQWETKLAQTLEGMKEVLAYVKNQNLGFKIPYTHEGRAGTYYPDYIVRLDDGRGSGDPLNLVIETTGRQLPEKEAKTATARRLWVPAVNAEVRFGRWAFLEDTDPWDAQTHIRRFLASGGVKG
ncbi:MAG: BPTD_3080 family restriction endonuclease, partial [Gemmataceae bacterium]